MDYVPTKQLALADVYRDATAVIDALGWDPEMVPAHDERRGAAHSPAISSSCTSAAATCWPPTSTSSTDIGADNTSQRRGDGRDLRQPPRRRSPQQASSTPTATRSRRSPSQFRCGV